jgi:hypothetical protein
VVTILIAWARLVLPVWELAALEVVVTITIETGNAWTSWAMALCPDYEPGTKGCTKH